MQAYDPVQLLSLLKHGHKISDDFAECLDIFFAPVALEARRIDQVNSDVITVHKIMDLNLSCVCRAGQMLAKSPKGISYQAYLRVSAS